MALRLGQNIETSAIHGFNIAENAYNNLLHRIRSKGRPSPVSNSLVLKACAAMKQPKKRSSRVIIFGGLILAGFGVLATYDLMHPATERLFPLQLQSMIYFGPILLAVGCVICLRGFAWGERSCSHSAVLMMGLAMLVIGGCPWLYTSYLTGGRPGNEAAGMLGTLIFIFIGLPGLALTVAGLISKPRNSKKGRSDG